MDNAVKKRDSGVSRAHNYTRMVVILVVATRLDKNIICVSTTNLNFWLS